MDFVKSLVPVLALADRGLLEHTIAILLARVASANLADVIADVVTSDLGGETKELVIRLINTNNESAPVVRAGAMLAAEEEITQPKHTTSLSPTVAQSVVTTPVAATAAKPISHAALIPEWVNQLGKLCGDRGVVRKRSELCTTTYDQKAGKWRCEVPADNPLHSERDVCLVNGRVIMQITLAKRAHLSGWGVRTYLQVKDALGVLDEFEATDGGVSALKDFWQRWECEPKGGVPGACRAYALMLVKSDEAYPAMRRLASESGEADVDAAADRGDRSRGAIADEWLVRVEMRERERNLTEQLLKKFASMSLTRHELDSALAKNKARQTEIALQKTRLRDGIAAASGADANLHGKLHELDEEHRYLYVENGVLWRLKSESSQSLRPRDEDGRKRASVKTPQPLSHEEQMARAEAAKQERLTRAEAAAAKRERPDFGAMKKPNPASCKQKQAGKQAANGKKAARNNGR